ncbi:hypothetical protein pipiens_004992 [Culex pipiens pipiens]|uniref:Arrestin C-terminal-like domain-containing protein n=1 Tax=Culex pipiens pipiens TaxID=38569 RepID=A0ABD1CCM9_CULPP
MTVSVEVQYDNNPQGIFYAGQTLSGSAVLKLTESDSVNAISIKIEGFTVVHWSERRPQGQRRRSRHFTARQDYLNSLSYLVGGTPNGPSVNVPEGTHVYKFTCVLPDNLPTSFEGQYGHIRYTATILVERPTQKNTTYREAFTVLRHVNLNDDPSLKIPKKLELSKTFGWWVFKSDPLNIVVEIPCTGFVPGQAIPVTVRWDNSSNASIHGVRIKLFKNEEYQATDPYEKKRTDQQSVVKVENRDMHKQGQVRFERNLTIPAVPPTSVSPLIKISYELVVYVHISSGDNPVFNVPISIGTIPLMGPPPGTSSDDQPPPPPQPPKIGFNVDGMSPPEKSGGAPGPSQPPAANIAGPSAPSTTQTATSPNELPPPTYEEAMSVTVSDHSDNEEESQAQEPVMSKPFMPRYPVYNFEDPGKGTS